MNLRTHSFIVLGVNVILLIISLGVARAYALPSTTTGNAPIYGTSSFNFGTWNGNAWQSLSAPFANFTQSLQSISATQLNLAVPAVIPNFSLASSGAAHDLFMQFDAWLAASTGGFHISQVLVYILEFIGWILGSAKNIVDWALSAVR